MTELARSANVQGTVRMIWAQARDGILGADGTLPWDLPEDRRLFRQLTVGSTVVMGRRTWESLPPRVRPLPGRRNVVLSATLSDVPPGVRVAASVDEVRAAFDDFWVIGGAGVYRAFLPDAAQVVMTEVDADFRGDVRAPRLDASWRRTSRTPGEGWSVSATGLRYSVSWWTREPATSGAASRYVRTG